MTVAFLLGRESQLSLAELKAAFPEAKFINHFNDLALFEMKEFTKAHFHQLGGSIKAMMVEPVAAKDLASTIKKSILKNHQDKEKKLYLGFSVYKAGEISDSAISKRQKHLNQLSFTLKKELKEEGYSVRVVTGKEPQLSSVIVKKNKLVSDQGNEFVVLDAGEELYAGTTIAVQDFEGFSHRDFDRPAADTVSGMLPPKLSRMMINLAGIPFNQDTVLLDPFCGSGTVLGEAMQMGVGKVMGSDNSDKAVEDSIANTNWISLEYPTSSNVKIEQVDARELTSWLPEKHIDVIVTEPFLGNPVRARLQKKDLVQRQKELAELYEASLSEIHRVLKDDGRVVMVLPFIDAHRIQFSSKLKKYWQFVPLSENERKSLDYKRPNQKVGREIVVLKKAMVS